MPRFIRLTARYGNALVAIMNISVIVVGLREGRGFWVIMFIGFLAAFAVFNIYVIEECAKLISEDEWLKGEVR